MQVTFLSHSGFLVETEHISLLFDWWKGALPPLSQKPLLVFVSHSHEDHFSPAVFSLDNRERDVHFLLGSDITLPKFLPPETAGKCTFFHGEEPPRPFFGATVEVLPSTDQGVAFLVHAAGKTIFHAGDLNWWHWTEETAQWNQQMERDFKTTASALAGREIDLAMLPMDPRQGQAGFWGMTWLLQLTCIHHCLPMHQWERFGFTQEFLATYPHLAAQITPIQKLGQRFTF